ncbi:hypothetical protein ALI144C_34950 [Actinosynnema sp. ALI-1.44]|uniref:hypothetical protein n=1 Tax=Actinosynnema sp. ALI-1.44 TaxID=1933779 RepID=UPI00097C3F29|nr:hypothetical protein [Actinosynnema sp. ALI-1.44]ONI77264.1 hypothetical protein ALI144C_34950 [Actinosynnema sp. ALI-1.44]
MSAALLLTGTAVAVLLLTSPARPELDEDLLRAVAPVVHTDLPTNRKVVWPSQPGGRWFCAQRPVEIRRDGDDVRLGLIANCSMYVRRDAALVLSGGFSGGLVAVLTPGPDGYRVRDVEVPVDGAGNAESLKRMFSTAGYEEVRRSTGRTGLDPTPQARAAFGLPANAPVASR